MGRSQALISSAEADGSDRDEAEVEAGTAAETGDTRAALKRKRRKKLRCGEVGPRTQRRHTNWIPGDLLLCHSGDLHSVRTHRSPRREQAALTSPPGERVQVTAVTGSRGEREAVL